MSWTSRATLYLVAAAALGGCPTPEPPIEPLLPDDYLTTFTEVRDCRQSGDHDLNRVRVLAGPAALAPYRDRLEPFPVGSLVVKEEYDFGDPDCSGPPVGWTVMQRLPEGSAPDFLDWEWEHLDEDFAVRTEVDTYRCSQCHMGCDPPSGYQGTCTEP